MTEDFPERNTVFIAPQTPISKRLVTVFAVIAIGLSACATQTTAPSEQEFGETMAQTEVKVSNLLESGNKEEAARVLAEVARTNPERKEPWVRMAKLYFDDARYSQAIVSAEEALQRDRADQTAKSIRAVSGLRVAAQSLNDLRSDVELQGNARADATGLAMVMRDILGEDVLVPPAELEARKKRESNAKKRVPVRTRKQAPAAKPQPSKDATQPAGGGNPFSILK